MDVLTVSGEPRPAGGGGVMEYRPLVEPYGGVTFMQKYIFWLKSHKTPPSEEQRAAWFRKQGANIKGNIISYPEKRCGTCGYWCVEDGPDDGSAFQGLCACKFMLSWFDAGTQCNQYEPMPYKPDLAAME